jgi:hypothetical protein
MSAQSIIITDPRGKTPSRTKVYCFLKWEANFLQRSLQCWGSSLGTTFEQNSKSLLFPHLQQHGFENPEYGVYFHNSYPTKEKTLKDMLA